MVLIQMITVNTPTSDDGSANTQYIMNCVQSIAEHMTEYRLIVNKSTAPIGTVAAIRQKMQAALNVRDQKILFHVASNPEFLREGAAVRDFLEPDRIILGTDDDDARALLDELYASFNQDVPRVIHMDIESAELTKYAANAMLATKLALLMK